MDKFENEKLNDVNINNKDKKNEDEFENRGRQVEYINIFWDEWRML